MIVFDFKNYKNYLKKVLDTKGDARGSRSKLAKVLGCQTGFISQVLNGNTHFSLEHCAGISKYIGHDEEEKHFFMLLCQLDKAGSVELREYYLAQIHKILNERKEIKNRIKVINDLNEVDFITYYSQWYFAAIHVLVSIHAFQTKESISKRLNLNIETTNLVLKFLVEKGLIIEDSGKFSVGQSRIHLDRKSPLISKHHTNWKIEAIKSLEKNNHSDLHYSSVVALSKKDAEKIKEVMLKSLVDIEDILRPSPEEEIYSISMDYFTL
ncbi:MAG: hypothetical protein A2202_02540 [Bdellovibrionales bacterium RIFOXYA1_FULL_36_14]|nr:MAG: hypothetical protein A2202_02540 [Bdellovibrionales bacterium RIFOXYA1_FULL_36_14]